MKKAIGLALAILTTSVVAAGAQGGQKVAAAGTASVSCNSTLKIALVTPLTGGAGFLGNEQVELGQVRDQDAGEAARAEGEARPRRHAGGAGARSGAGARAEVRRRTRASSAILGPSTSGAVAASSTTYGQAGIAHISPSATRTSLTQGRDQGGDVRVLPRRPGRLHPGPDRCALHDRQAEGEEGRAARLPGALLGGSRGCGRGGAQEGAASTTSRLSAPNTTTDYSAYVTKVPNDADIVFFPTQKPGDAQTFAQQLIEQGKKAKVFGGDGSNDASAVQGAGLVRLELRTGHHGHRGRQGDHRRLEEGQPRQVGRLLRPAELWRRAGRC